MEDDFVGAIKIKDGLFIGDEYAAQDFEFVVTNKVTHVINTAGKQIPNYWETVGVAYLTYDWMDSENQIVFDPKGEVVEEIFNFIEEAAKLGEGVLVHSVKGQSRSCCVLTCYFMKRYRWSLYKTLEFLTSRRSDLEIRTSFYHQLLNLEAKLFQQSEGNVTVNWFEAGKEDDHEEMLLRNTFLNARSAPFDEALVNPQLGGVDLRPRTLNWVDEKGSNKGTLHSYFTKETLAAKQAKPALTSVKSILKGSNKVLKLKTKNSDDSSSSSSKGDVSPAPGLRVHKSMRNLSEGRSSESVDEVSSKLKAEKSNSSGNDKYSSKTSHMARSSSATCFDKDDNQRSLSIKGSSSNEKTTNKMSNINGNIIHLTVNNYLAPVNNINNLAQPSSTSGKEQKTKSAVTPQSQTSKNLPPKYNLPTDMKKDEPTNNKLAYSESSFSNVASVGGTQLSDKNTLSTNQLKSAIEKKLSKEYKAQMATMSKGDVQAITAKTPTGANDAKGVKSLKEYAKPTDLKVNYQVLLKNRETPPPRKREEAKKIPESPQRKAASKSTVMTSKGPGDNSLPYSSYLNGLFSTSFSHLNAATPSTFTANYASGEKKTPISAKATPMTYNLTLSQKAQTLTRPQRTNSSQNNDKANYSSSVLGSNNIPKSKMMYTNDPSSASSLSVKYNNYLSQTKGNPVRVTYEKIERPHSATPDRSVTPQAGARKMATTSNTGIANKSAESTDQRLSVPSKNKHAKKDSGSTNDLLSKYRQRSSSPSQMGYNPVLSSSSISLKSKSKY